MQSIAPAPPQSMQNQVLYLPPLSCPFLFAPNVYSPKAGAGAGYERGQWYNHPPPPLHYYEVIPQTIYPVPVHSCLVVVADMILPPLADLRAQLAAVINTSQHQHGGPPPGPHGYDVHHQSSSASPHDHNIDPAIGGAGPGGIMSTGGDSGGDDSLGDGRKGGKRELSQSKRAAQNRAAQRAFRQRKEGYIKKLEEQVRDLHNLEDNYKALQAENYSLREYIIHLQSRLIESQGEYPQPPPNVNLIHPHARHDQRPVTEPVHVQHGHLGHNHHNEQGSAVAPLAPMSLQASAARTLAAAGLQSGKHAQEEQHPYDHSKRYKDEGNDSAAADEEIIRNQLQASADGLPASM
ncbi:hypothetical protein EG329_014214 [Mollisiaceae sp. DMI_Dod_QoI]|nr:hypothetical protein EG329_014214 [Helotiales sp. DMI_Dod_QoI]